MDDDPKNPNAWWAVKFRWPENMDPKSWSKAQKKRMAWIFAIELLFALIVIFYMNKLMQMR
jgi:hypothetical protein